MFDIVEHRIDAAALRRDLLDDAAGGLVIFEGLVRDHNEGRAVSALEYEIYEAMAGAEAARIFAEAREQFDVIELRGAHRSGRLEIGEMAVWVGASARHRAEAFKACRYLIDQIKYRLPVWKKEHYVEGSAEWVDCKGCYHHHEPAFSEEEYYSRQLRLPDFGAPEQQLLRDARVLVVGAGGLGCPALSALTGGGVGRITICDGDRLAISNLHRQTLYDYEEVGQYKATLAAQRLAALNPLIRIAAHTERVGRDNIDALLAAHDVVLDCTDNFSTKYLLHDACFLAAKVLVQAGIHQYEGQLQVFDFRGEQSAGCLRCAWPEIPDATCVGSCVDVGVLGAVPAVLGSLQAIETIKLIVGRPSPATGATVLVDLLSLETSRIKRPRTPDCPLCGEQPRIRSMADEDYEQRRDWEVSLAVFHELNPGGRVVDIREDEDRHRLTEQQVAWQHVPASDGARLLDSSDAQDTLYVCQVGVKTRHLVEELRLAGNNRVWSLWRGVDGL